MSSRWDNAGSGSPSAPISGATAGQEAAARAAAIAATLGQGASARAPTESRKEGAFDGDFTHDIEINDLRNRYLLTKGSTQQQLHQETGASITTKGVWLPDKSKATAEEPPLYLHIAAMTKEVLDIAVGKVNELINQELGPLIEDRSAWARNRANYAAGGAPLTGANAAPAGGGGGEAPEGGAPVGFGPGRGGFGGGGRGGFGGGGFGGRGGKWPEEKVFINLESLRNFNVRAKVVGPGGMFVKHIQSETNTRVQIKGQGSGFYETETGREGEDPMHISISGPDESMIERAKLLADDLLLVVGSEWSKARDANQGGGYGGGGGGGYGQHNAAQAYYAAQGYGAPAPPPPTGDAPPPPPGGDDSAPPPPPADGNAAPAAEDPQEAYRKYWAAYGYDVNDPAFQAWQQQQYASYYTQQPGATPGAAPAPGGAPSTVAPAVPAAEQPGGSYSAVPPPQGL